MFKKDGSWVDSRKKIYSVIITKNNQVFVVETHSTKKEAEKREAKMRNDYPKNDGWRVHLTETRLRTKMRTVKK